MNICVIGASNIDIGGFSKNKATLKDSNIGSINYSFGGVGRNISENLVRLGSSVSLITVLGDDFYSKELIKDCNNLNIDISNSLIVKNSKLGSYLFISDNNGDMICAINDMSIYDELNIDFFKTKINIINTYDLCIIDTNIKEDSLKYLFSNIEIPIFVDPVSLEKGKKVLPYLDKITGFKPNILEAKEFTNSSNYKEASNKLLEKKVKNVFISLGKDGLYYANKNDNGIIKALDIDVINATGAGDCLISSLAYAYCLGYSIKDCAIFGVSASQICIQSTDTVSKEISFDKVKEIGREIENEKLS